METGCQERKARIAAPAGHSIIRIIRIDSKLEAERLPSIPNKVRATDRSRVLFGKCISSGMSLFDCGRASLLGSRSPQLRRSAEVLASESVTQLAV